MERQALDDFDAFLLAQMLGQHIRSGMSAFLSLRQLNNLCREEAGRAIIHGGGKMRQAEVTRMIHNQYRPYVKST